MKKNNVPPMEGRIIGYKGILELGFGMWSSGFRYKMPCKGNPGKWMRISRKLDMCAVGFHIAWPQTINNVEDWIVHHKGPPTLIRVELGGEFIYGKDKRAYEYCRILKVINGYEVVSSTTSHDFDIKLLRKLIREDKKSIKDGAGPG